MRATPLQSLREWTGQPCAAGATRLTIDEFAAEVRLTPRTIRNYHARGLLGPPARVGRTRYYGEDHLGRIRLVQSLQQSGLSLDAIAVLLEPDQLIGQLIMPDRLLATTLRANPDLAGAMLRCGVLTRLPDGSVRVRGARAVLAAIALRRPGVSPAEALHALVDAITTAMPGACALLSDVLFAIGDRLWVSDSSQSWLRELALPVLELAMTAATATTVAPVAPVAPVAHVALRVAPPGPAPMAAPAPAPASPPAPAAVAHAPRPRDGHRNNH